MDRPRADRRRADRWDATPAPSSTDRPPSRRPPVEALDRRQGPLRHPGRRSDADHVRRRRPAVRGLRGLRHELVRRSGAGRGAQEDRSRCSRTRTPRTRRCRCPTASCPTSRTAPGIANLYIPRLGRDYAWTIVQAHPHRGPREGPGPLRDHADARSGRQLRRRRTPRGQGPAVPEPRPPRARRRGDRRDQDALVRLQGQGRRRDRRLWATRARTGSRAARSSTRATATCCCPSRITPGSHRRTRPRRTSG